MTVEEWKRTRLRHHIKTRKGYAFKSKWYSEKGTPIVKVSDFTEDSVNISNLTHIPNEIAEQYKIYSLKKDDVIIQTVGSWPTNPRSVVGKVIKVPSGIHKALLNQNAVKIIPMSDLNNRYLFYLLRTNDFKNYIVGCAQGAANQASITLDSIRDYEFFLPPKTYQDKVASILSCFDDLIEVNLGQVRILEEIVQSTYTEWFVHLRYPGHENAEKIQTPHGPIPKGWEINKLSDMVKTQYGYTESATDEPIGPKFLRGMDINKTSYIDWSKVPYCRISEKRFKEFKLKKGDILVIRMADPGKAGIVEKDIDAVFASYLIRLEITSDRISPYYLYYFLLSHKYQGYIRGASTGTTRKSASAKVVTGIDILVPSKETLEQIEQIASELRDLLNTSLEKNALLREKRDLILPRLISGEIDTSTLDIDISGD